MMKRPFFILLAALTLTIGAIACKAKKSVTQTPPNPTTAQPANSAAVAKVDNTTCTEKVTYQTLKPLLSKSCNSCHDASMPRMNFTTFYGLKELAMEGEVKEHVLERKDMPPNEKLTDAELTMIRCWLEQGSPEK
jgi:uncharacterized membrane protein